MEKARAGEISQMSSSSMQIAEPDKIGFAGFFITPPSPIMLSLAQLVAGRPAREFDQTKKRKGTFREDRHHATAVETDHHLISRPQTT
jgi:hypothetical protein